jgi:hypothetical protein
MKKATILRTQFSLSARVPRVKLGTVRLIFGLQMTAFALIAQSSCKADFYIMYCFVNKITCSQG